MPHGESGAHPAIIPCTGPTLAILPQADDPAPELARFPFVGGGTPPHAPGVFVLTRRIGARLHPALIGEAEDIRVRDIAVAVDGRVWMQSPSSTPCDAGIGRRRG